MNLLNIGDKAPDFNVKNENGESISLNQFKNKKIILYFYPKDDTPGCTTEACNLRNNYEMLLEKGFVILGVSADNEAKHLKFKTKYNLPFHLLADTEKKILNAYGVWGEKKFLGKTYKGIHRVTYIIDENQKIKNIITKVQTKTHAEQILKEYNN